MPYIYATALPRDIVKIGYCTDERVRPFAAQMFFVEDVQLLALWHARDGKDEDRALWACRQWHAYGELFRVPTDWLETVHPVVTAISSALGRPLPAKYMPKAPRRKFGLRVVQAPLSIGKEHNIQELLRAMERPRRGRGRPPKGDPTA